MSQRSRKFRVLGLATLAIGIIAIGFAYYFVLPAWCTHVPTARITINGKPSQSQLYRKLDDQLILVLPQPDIFMYRIPPDRHSVYFSNNRTLKLVPRGAWDKRTGYGVDLGYVNGVKVRSIKADTDAKLIVRSNRIEFNGLETERIVIDW